MWIVPPKEFLEIAKIESIEKLDEVRTIKTREDLKRSQGVRRIYVFQASANWTNWAGDNIYKDAKRFYRGKQRLKRGSSQVSPAGSIYVVAATATNKLQQAHPEAIANIHAYMGIHGAVLCFADTSGYFADWRKWRKEIQDSTTKMQVRHGILYAVIDSKEVMRRIVSQDIFAQWDPTIPL